MKTRDEVEVKVGMKLYYVDYFYNICEGFVKEIRDGFGEGYPNNLVVIESEDFEEKGEHIYTSLYSFYSCRDNCIKDLIKRLQNTIKNLDKKIEEIKKDKEDLYSIINKREKELFGGDKFSQS